MPKGEDYPDWVCDDCGTTYGSWYKKGQYIGPPHHCCTYHTGKCGLCGATDVPVTQPRDYGHLTAKWRTEIIKKSL